jgi:import receptor subunit TOM22
MVLVEEVKEDVIVDRESDYETESEFSDDVSVASDDDFDPNETLAERIAALKDIVPPETRTAVAKSADAVVGWAKWAASGTGQVAWWVTTSALLVGLPLALAIEDEARITQQEREMQMQSAGQQQVSCHCLGRVDGRRGRVVEEGAGVRSGAGCHRRRLRLRLRLRPSSQLSRTPVKLGPTTGLLHDTLGPKSAPLLSQ